MCRPPRRVSGSWPSACEYCGVSAPALLLVLGDEELLATRAVNQVVEAVRQDDPVASVSEFQGSDLLPGELAGALSPSLFGGRPVVIVYNGQDAKKDLTAALLAYAANADPGASLVICHAGGAKGKALADGLKQAGAEVALAAKVTRHADKVDFIRSEIRRLGGKCSGEAAEALLDAVGNDLRELAAACHQLMADTNGRIELDVVQRYYKGRAEVSGFAVADAAVAGDVPAALEALRWALATGVDPVPIADALADGVRTVARVASAGRGGNAYQLASKLGMPAWKIEKAQRMARGWTPEGLVDAMAAAAVCNAEVKGGSDDRGYALERAIMAMAAARSGR
ncbi:MAG: DNA polymerase III subunit delta [Hamadaea sp.]|uniref:DNA polymerase III subunit delta n=1 Tax=Hamadaea sp. NPDC050747 TaxID=3155789 RepID=UPI0017E2EF2D|nr:DNA polymerase III subunit delta [Hamadaea sp.]NUR52554.1 DNA polymerase III subunit delta [Hamadaea sp.]NUT06362.1 DNA polymerase III subunit delta [Hamadaea sp.]